MRTATLLLLVLTSSLIFAQNKTKEELIEYLTDNSYKEWTLEDTQEFLGLKSCTKGTKYTFHKNGKLDMLTCHEGDWVSETFNWKLIKENELDWVLRINDKSNLNVIVYSKDEREMLKLRSYSIHGNMPTVDMDFFNEEE